jgi:hypothetical protein
MTQPEQYNNLTKQIGSYSSYIARKVAIQNLNSITKCNYAKNHNFSFSNNKLIYSNNYQSLNNLKTYVRQCNLGKNDYPLKLSY